MTKRASRDPNLPPELAALVASVSPAQMRELVPQLLAVGQERMLQELLRPGPCARSRVLAGRHNAPTEDSGGIWRWNDDPDLTPLDLDALDADLAAWSEEATR